MANTIQLKLLENKTIVAEVNGRNYSYEGGYRIVAGEKGATTFEIVSIPNQYKNFDISIVMTNAQGETIPQSKINIVDNRRFNLPEEMAVEGYSSITIKAIQDDIVVVWFPLKVKVWNNDWKQSMLAPALITVGKTETLPPGFPARVSNVGNDKYVILDFNIPQGASGITAPAAGLFTIGMDIETGEIYCEYVDQGEAPQFEYNEETGEIFYIIDE